MQLLTKLFLLLFLFACITANAQKRSARLEIHFASGKADLSRAAIMRLDSLADSLHQALKYEIKIAGHTDSRGDSLENILLSQRRTAAVEEYLREQGIQVKTTVSHGDRRPQSDNENPEGQAQNRRVEIAVRYIPKPLPTSPLPLSPQPSSTTIADLYALLQNPPQEYCINPIRDTFLHCADGTVIHVKAASFARSQACAGQCLTLKVKEVFEKSNMILENLGTTSGGRVLESRGMVYTEVEDCAGNKVDLLPGKAMVISLPTAESMAGFQIFKGVRQDPKDRINWVADPTAGLSTSRLNQLSYCGAGIQGQGVRCKFFCCKIRNFLTRIFFGKNFFQGGGSSGRSYVRAMDACKELMDLCKKYGIQDPSAFFDALNFELLDSLGYSSASEMLEKMDPAQLDAMMMRISKTKIPRAQYQYSNFNSRSTGWANCDRFQNLPPEQLANIKLELVDDPRVDCKLVMRKMNILVSGVSYRDAVYFQGIQKNEPATVIALKYENGKAYLATRDIVTEPGPFALDFKEYSIPDLKTELKKLDFQTNM
jgi:hypothetical protein